MIRNPLFGIVLLVGFGSAAWSANVTVPYNGSFDEADVPGPQDGLPAGDYDTIGGLPDTGLFDLVAGDNTFEGSIWSPGDTSDSFAIGLGPQHTLTGARIDFGTNLSPFTPMFAFPAPRWTLEEASPTPTIFDLQVGFDGMSTTQLVVAPAFERGEGVYTVLIGNGTFGVNAGNFDTPIDYTMTFETVVVPSPSSGLIMIPGVAAIMTASRRLRRRQR